MLHIFPMELQGEEAEAEDERENEDEHEDDDEGDAEAERKLTELSSWRGKVCGVWFAASPLSGIPLPGWAR